MGKRLEPQTTRKLAASVGPGEIHSSIDRRLSSPLKLDVARQSKDLAMKQDDGFELKTCVVVVVVSSGRGQRGERRRLQPSAR